MDTGKNMKSKIIFIASMSLLCTSIYAQVPPEDNLSEYQRNYIESCNAEYPFAHWFTAYYSLREPGYKREGYQMRCKRYGIDISDKITAYDNYRNNINNERLSRTSSAGLNRSLKLTSLYNRALELTQDSPPLPYPNLLEIVEAIKNVPNEEEKNRIIQSTRTRMETKRKEPPRLNIPALGDFKEENDGLPFDNVDVPYPSLASTDSEVSLITSLLNKNCRENNFDTIINEFNAAGHKNLSQAVFQVFISETTDMQCALLVMARKNDSSAYSVLKQIYEFAPKLVFERTWNADTHSPDDEIRQLKRLLGQIIRLRSSVLTAMRTQGGSEALKFLQDREHRGTTLGDIASDALQNAPLDQIITSAKASGNKPIWQQEAP